MYKLVIIGGSGAMGQLFSELFENQGYSVDCLDKGDWEHAETMLTDADAAIVVVPIDQTLQVIQAVADLLPESAVLADLTSIKAKPLEAMLHAHAGPVIGLHPVFGPTISSTEKEVIVYCEGRDTKAASWLLDAFDCMGFTLHSMSAKRHDQAMDFIQGAEHFTTFCMGAFLKSEQANLNDLLAVASPVYRTKLNLMGRIFDQDPELYADIIWSDPKRRELLHRYAQLIQYLLADLDTEGRDAFIKGFGSIAKWLGPFTEQAQEESDHLLALSKDSSL